MEYLVTAEQMRRCDRATSEHFHVGSAVLMERAALSCVEMIKKRQERAEALLMEVSCQKRTLIVAGVGNNGGDGFAIGRLLMQEGYPVHFWLVGDRERATALTAEQMASVEAYGGQIMRKAPEAEYDIIVDALFGVGLSRDVSGIYKEAIDYINRSAAFVLAVDIPSGIHADTGAVMGTAVCADLTVTFGFRKLGCVLYPGARYAGKLLCAPIGITQESFLGQLPDLFTFTEPVRALMPPRDVSGNKGTFGKVCLVAGSPGMAGAALLAGGAVFAAGAGMVKIVTAKENREILQGSLPEAMTACYGRGEGGLVCQRAVGWADVIAAGPGLSTGEDAAAMLRFLIRETVQPLVLDADAINLLAKEEGLLTELMERQADEKRRRTLVLTPHPGELARLEGRSVGEVLQDKVRLCRKWASLLQASVLFKQDRTLVGAPEGLLYVNCSGNSGMATAGSGDVLTGVIAGLLAQGMDGFGAACTGVYLHGLAGDRAAHLHSEYSMKAGDITAMIPRLLSDQDRRKKEN